MRRVLLAALGWGLTGCLLLVPLSGYDDGSAEPRAPGDAGQERRAGDADARALAPGETRVFAGNTNGAVVSRTRATSGVWSGITTELTLAGAPRFLVPALVPGTFDEIVAIQLAGPAATTLEVRRRTQTDWVVDLTNGTTPKTDADKRTFDLEFEASSGDGLLVYATSGAGVPAFRTRTGGAWSAEQSVPLGGAPAGRVLWVDLVRRPGTNEITLAFSTTAQDLYVETWDGTNWDTATYAVLETDLNTTAFAGFALAYENLSGDLLAVWGRSQPSSPYVTPYATRAAGSKTFAATQTIAATPSAPMSVASEPGSDRIAFAWLEDTCGNKGVCDDFVAATWSGTAWTHVAIVDPNIGALYKTRPGSLPVGVAWLGGSAFAVYESSNPQSSDLRWTRFADNAWQVPTTASAFTPGLGDQVTYLPLAAGTANVTFLVANSENIWAKTCDGTRWSDANGDVPLFDFGTKSGVPLGTITRAE